MKNIKKFLALILAIVAITAISVPAMAATTKYVNCTPDLNFREGPGTSYNLISRIPYRSAVSEIGTVNGWSYITYNGVNGYVMTQYLSTTRPPILEHPATKAEAFGSATLSVGSSGVYVKNVQLALQRGGFYTGSISGSYNSATQAAVTRYQTYIAEKGDPEMTVNGTVDHYTKAYLWSMYGSYLQDNGYV